MKKIFFSVMGVAAAGLVFAQASLAADIVQPSKDNPNVIIGSGQTYNNLYTAGGSVTVNGDTNGDLTVAGGMITIDGKVQQELLAAGGTIFLNSQVGSHARIIGGNITITAPIGGDLVVAGGNVNLTGNASVSGDLLVAGGNVVVDAPVNGSVKAVGGTVTIDSRIGGDVNVRASGNLIFGPNASVPGQVTYKGVRQAVVQNGANVPNIEFIQLQKGAGAKTAGLLTLAFLVKLLAWIAAGLLLVYYGKDLAFSAYQNVRSKPWPSLGWGFLGIVAIPVIVIILLITLIGYYIALLLGLSYALLLLFVNLVSAVVLGYLLLSLLNKSAEKLSGWQAVVLGTVIWTLLGFIPFIGWIIKAIIFLMVFGAVIKRLKTAWK
ncbi:MAG: hypothetical protein M1383_01030 [Patescibacteria group bacterium]|nr:hypothetical protein [Patescibacteria group bacterium]